MKKIIPLLLCLFVGAAALAGRHITIPEGMKGDTAIYYGLLAKEQTSCPEKDKEFYSNIIRLQDRLNSKEKFEIQVSSLNGQILKTDKNPDGSLNIAEHAIRQTQGFKSGRIYIVCFIQKGKVVEKIKFTKL